MPLNEGTAPTSEPITLVEAKAHLRIDIGEDDGYIEDILIPAARLAVEAFTRRQLFTATYDLYLDSFPGSGEIRLPRPPLASITNIKYLDADGDEQTEAATVYTADTYSEPGRIYLAYGQSWSATRGVRNSVYVRFVCGYTTVPAHLKHATAMLVADMYEQREARIEMVKVEDNPTVERLLWAWRFMGETDL